MKCINCKKEIKENDEFTEIDVSRCFAQVFYDFGDDTIYLCKNCNNDEKIKEKVTFDFLTGKIYDYYEEE